MDTTFRVYLIGIQNFEDLRNNNSLFVKAGYTSGFYHPFLDITGFLTEVNPYLE